MAFLGVVGIQGGHEKIRHPKRCIYRFFHLKHEISVNIKGYSPFLFKVLEFTRSPLEYSLFFRVFHNWLCRFPATHLDHLAFNFIGWQDQSRYSTTWKEWKLASSLQKKHRHYTQFKQMALTQFQPSPPICFLTIRWILRLLYMQRKTWRAPNMNPWGRFNLLRKNVRMLKNWPTI